MEGLNFIEFLIDNLGAFSALIFIVTLIPFAGMVMMYKLLKNEQAKGDDHGPILASVDKVGTNVSSLDGVMCEALGAINMFIMMQTGVKPFSTKRKTEGGDKK